MTIRSAAASPSGSSSRAAPVHAEPAIKFGTDGWRGQIARDFTFDNVRKVAQAVAEFLKNIRKSGLKLSYRDSLPIPVGYDRRFQSKAFAAEIARVLRANRLNAVLFAEPLPTPALSFLTHKTKTIGLMVTASHNPFNYNGVKIKVEGCAASEEFTRLVESHIGAEAAPEGAPAPEKSFKEAYLAFLRSRVDAPALSRKLKRPVVVDYMYGAGIGLLGELLASKKLVSMHDRHDPLFGGLHPEPIEKNLRELKNKVAGEKALVGLATDGDADRLGVVDDRGEYLTPCQVFPLLLEHLIAHRKLKGKVVQSVSMGMLAERIAKANGLPFEEVPVGFKFIAQKMLSGDCAFGGEESGGYGWRLGLPERDGLLNALLFLELLTETGKTPSALLAALEKKYGASCFQRVDYRIHRPVEKTVFAERIHKKIPRKVLDTPVKEIRTIDGIKLVLQDDAWLLMRPSGTEPLIRTYAESSSPKKTQALLELALKWVGGHVLGE